MTTPKPFGYFGGKHILAPYLETLLPPHDCYCEVFGGSGALLFHKQPSRVEVFNDVDGHIVNFFRILRDRDKAAELQRLLMLTPYAREEYLDCFATMDEAPDDIEQARRWYVAVRQGFSGRIKQKSWGMSRQRNHGSTWFTSIGMFEEFHYRLKGVQIDNNDFEKVIETYDGPDTCFYLDPPYMRSTRREKDVYHHEMSREDHERLLACCLKAKGMIVLSGYDNPLYRDTLKGWECIQKTLSCSAAGRTRASNLQGDGVTRVNNQMRTEHIWLNSQAVYRDRSLFNWKLAS